MSISRIMNHSVKFVLTIFLVAGIVSAAIVPVQAAPLPQSTLTDWIQLSIQDIEAVNVTNGEPVNDEMAAGAILASIHGIDQIDYVDLGEFTVGTKKEYDNWILAEVPVSDLTDVVQVELSLVEMDLGGGKDVHLSLLGLRHFELTKAAMMAHFFDELNRVTAAEQGQQPNAVPLNFGILLGNALRAGITSALASILNTLWNIIVGIIADDPFQPVTIVAPTLVDLQNGSISGQITVEDYGATYQVSYTWNWVEKPTVAVQAAATPQVDYQPDYSFAETIGELQAAWNSRLQERLFLPVIFAQ